MRRPTLRLPCVVHWEIGWLGRRSARRSRSTDELVVIHLLCMVTLSARLAERARPARPAILRQRWEQLLFLHWRREPAEIQAMLPPGLHVDTHDGSAWVGLTPFRMHRVRPALLPP